MATLRPPKTTSLGVVPARLARPIRARVRTAARRGRCDPLRAWRVNTFSPERSANSNSSVFVYRRADRRAADGAVVIRLGEQVGLCETLVSWRLLVGGLSPWLSHRSYSTTSEEPPLSIFNSYWDIPPARSRVLAAKPRRCLGEPIPTSDGRLSNGPALSQSRRTSRVMPPPEWEGVDGVRCLYRRQSRRTNIAEVFGQRADARRRQARPPDSECQRGRPAFVRSLTEPWMTDNLDDRRQTEMQAARTNRSRPWISGRIDPPDVVACEFPKCA